MIRYLILGALLYLVGLLLRRVITNQREGGKPSPKPPTTSSKTTARCAHCGLFVPRDQALVDGERFYCSREHLQADRRDS